MLAIIGVVLDSKWNKYSYVGGVVCKILNEINIDIVLPLLVKLKSAHLRKYRRHSKGENGSSPYSAIDMELNQITSMAKCSPPS